MNVNELIERLTELRDQMGNVKVQVYSTDYCLDIHKITNVTDGWDDGWREHNNVIGINVSR